MYENSGRKIIIMLLFAGAIFGATIGVKYVLPFLKEEAGQTERK
jgi:hypothetical protein